MQTSIRDLSIRHRASVLQEKRKANERSVQAHDAQSRGRPSRYCRFATVASVFLLLTGLTAEQAAFAQTRQRESSAHQKQQKRVNDGALMILSGRPGTTYFTIARDIATSVGEAEDLRHV